MTQEQPRIYALKITLQHSKPSIWRRIHVADTTTLATLHRVIQIVMGWTDDHLHRFIHGTVSYAPSDIAVELFGGKDSSQYMLSQLLIQPKDSLIYHYDFGDDWLHKVVLEKILPADEPNPKPKCIKGQRACPHEDIGGLGGHYDFLSSLEDPPRYAHEHYRERFGDQSFDPDAFDINAVNQRLMEVEW